ncbi:beta-lactamase family protein [Alteriqipengyuania sp. NZ-12B]|uniref:Beta-lactamase family protein n=1 Tax=Alteriqipengyuania abyssalis TaxID=2860200 RepID=A0ABS7PDG2_9SPHN|nr:beta-lactamase family protein [Alteriqipengyuania abyssalis]
MNKFIPGTAGSLLVLLGASLMSAGCATPSPPGGVPVGEVDAGMRAQREALERVLAEHRPQAAAIGIIKDGHLYREYYFGQEREGVAVNAASRFEVASVSKMIASETFLRMVAAGDASLDMKLADYWTDPDLAGDPRLQMLTARHVLTHKTGFPNWRFFRADGKLAFEADPGARYGYSGEGFQYLFRALERKTGLTYPQMVERYLLVPLGIDDAVVGFEEQVGPAMVWNRTPEGEWLRPDCRPGFCWPAGDWSAAGGLKISLEDLARILISVGSADGYDDALAEERDRIVTDRGTEAVVDCTLAPTQCPLAQGYGLGMLRVDGPQSHWIGHEGGDWSQLTLAVIDRTDGDGIVVLLAGPMEQDVGLMSDLLELIDPDNPWTVRFAQWQAQIAADR